jgi:hypothetical protein
MYSMPMITRVQPKKMALPGVMRITPEGTYGTWPGDNMNQCAAQFSCPPPTMTVYVALSTLRMLCGSPISSSDTFMPFGNKFIDVSAGGPDSFTFTATANESWVKLSPSSGSVTATNNEKRVLLSVDWSKVQGATGAAIVTFSATSKTQSAMSVQMTLLANHTSVPSGFKGEDAALCTAMMRS